MSLSVALMVVGVALFLAGLAKLGSRQSGGFNLSHFGLNFGGQITQSTNVRDIGQGETKKTKTDWAGVAIAALGLLTAIFGWLKG